MILEAIRKFARDHFSHKYFPVLHGKTDKIQPLALVVKQNRQLWKRPFAKSEMVIFADIGKYVKDGVEQKTVCKTVAANIKDEELSVKQKVDMGASSDEVDVNVAGFAGVTAELCDNQGVITLGSLSQKYISDPDLRGILANAELDANKMKAFAECDELLLITSVIYSEKFELEGEFERMHQVQTEVAAEEKNLPPQLQFLNLHRNLPLKIHVRDTYFPPHAAARNSQAPFLFKCCDVDYNKETNRLEIRKREYVGNVLSVHEFCHFEEDDDAMVETTDQTDPPGCLTANDIERMDKIYRVVLLSEKTTAQRKARVSKYRHWFEKALMTGNKKITLEEGMTLEDCDFLKSVYFPCAQHSNLLDLSSLSTDEIQDFAIAFKVLDDLSDEQWKGLELSLAADPEHQGKA